MSAAFSSVDGTGGKTAFPISGHVSGSVTQGLVAVGLRNQLNPILVSIWLQ